MILHTLCGYIGQKQKISGWSVWEDLPFLSLYQLKWFWRWLMMMIFVSTVVWNGNMHVLKFKKLLTRKHTSLYIWYRLIDQQTNNFSTCWEWLMINHPARTFQEARQQRFFFLSFFRYPCLFITCTGMSETHGMAAFSCKCHSQADNIRH